MALLAATLRRHAPLSRAEVTGCTRSMSSNVSVKQYIIGNRRMLGNGWSRALVGQIGQRSEMSWYTNLCRAVRVSGDA